VSILALGDAELARKLTGFRESQRDAVLEMTLPPAE
jgi:phosphoribosylcarboxyaminoimidazole (NCAIR) mutase